MGSVVSSAGVTRGVQWWFDVRFLPLRTLLLAVTAAGYLLILTDAPSLRDWAIGLLAVLATAGGVRWPFLTSLVVSGVLLLGFEVGDTGPVVAKVAAAVALIEVSARRSGWQPWLAAGALAGAYLLHPSGELAANGYRALVMAGAPLLVGALLRTARESAEHARRQAQEMAQRRDAEVAAARAVERTAIARELHDLIAHHVSSTVLRVGVARHAMPDAPAGALEVLDDIHASGKETLTDLRRLVAILRDPAMTDDPFIAPADLPDALTAVVMRAGQSGVTVTTALAEDITEVDAVLALTMLRLTQEGVANIVQHAGPGTTARLSITMQDGVLHFLLRDNGSRVRSEPAPAGAGHGLGLIGLRERVELLGGEFTAACVGTEWQLAARLPVGKQALPTAAAHEITTR
ncbi:sensor histidine kinase [Nocardia altamirensis]|uniref:sensor histidine kinase n=1 Tax=Nocardia altamirensis TaxID=472158 RepID=UPI001FE0D424|nr:histidine kinase [Nocardia altamirensis]